MNPTVDMAEAAGFAGLCYDRFRKGWRGLVRSKGLPAPFRERPYVWRREALQDWQARQEAAIRAAALGLRPAANDAGQVTAPAPPRVARQRARIKQRMGAC